MREDFSFSLILPYRNAVSELACISNAHELAFRPLFNSSGCSLLIAWSQLHLPCLSRDLAVSLEFAAFCGLDEFPGFKCCFSGYQQYWKWI